MPQRYFVEISYDGTPFHGWQIQPNAVTVQQQVNDALSTVLRKPIYCIGCGRTDTGVHARQFFAHFDIDQMIEDIDHLMFHANCMLPYGIAIHRIFNVEERHHARFSAMSRTYEYWIVNRKDPFAVKRKWHFREALDTLAMNEAASWLLNCDDFECFSKAHGDTDHHRCTIYHAEWYKLEDGYRFEIKANRFLRNMVRAIVGTCVEVGLGRLTLEDFKRIVDSKNRSEAGVSVPAHGLYLINVEYPTDLFS